MTDELPLLDGTAKQMDWAAKVRGDVIGRLRHFMETARIEAVWQDRVLGRMATVTSSGQWLALKDTPPFKVFVRFLNSSDFTADGFVCAAFDDPTVDRSVQAVNGPRIEEITRLVDDYKTTLAALQRQATVQGSDPASLYYKAKDLYEAMSRQVHRFDHGRRCGRLRSDGQPCQGTASDLFEAPVCAAHMTDEERACSRDRYIGYPDSNDFGLRFSMDTGTYLPFAASAPLTEPVPSLAGSRGPAAEARRRLQLVPTEPPTISRTDSLYLDAVLAAWQGGVLDSLTMKAKARYRGGCFMSAENDVAVFALPNSIHRDRCEEIRPEVEAVLGRHLGRPIRLDLVVAHVEGEP